MCLSECGRFSSSESEILPTVKFAAHHRDLERLEVALHKCLTVEASVGPGSIEEQNLHIGAVLGQYRRLYVDQKAHEVLLVGGLGKPKNGLNRIGS